MILNCGRLKIIKGNLLCKKYEEEKSGKKIDDFTNYANKNADQNVFQSLAKFEKETKRDANGIHIIRDTVGLSTALTCKYKNDCKIRVPYKKENWGGGQESKLEF